MRRARLNGGKSDSTSLPKLAAVAILALGCFAAHSMAQQPGQRTFSSPEEASNAFVTAMQGNDEKAMLDILGADGRQIVSSGDETEDAQNRANFVARYQEMHRLVKEPDGTTTLYIGAKNWPTPYRSRTKVIRGISTPRPGRWKFCTDELAGTRCPRFVFARSW